MKVSHLISILTGVLGARPSHTFSTDTQSPFIMFKTAITSLLLTVSVSAFGTTPFGVTSSRASSAIFEGKINDTIDLDSPKVVNTDELAAGEKKVYCRCWKSGTFPLCDAAHVEHNKECGDNVGPLIVSAAKEE